MNSNILGFLTSSFITIFFGIIFLAYQFIQNPDLEPIVFLSRTSGIVAFLVFSFSVIYGLYQSNKLFLNFKFLDVALALSTHRYLSWTGVFLAVIHRQAHEYYMDLISFTPALMTFRGFLIALGNLGLIIFLILVVSSELRGKFVPMIIWKSLHYLSFIGYFLILGHALLLGSNSDSIFYLFWYLSTLVVILGLVFLRIYNSILNFIHKKTAES